MSAPSLPPEPETSAPAWRRGDALALASLVACALVLAWPILAGGSNSYLDHAPHLAEIDALARGESWSEIGFAGFPLLHLHSPLWHGALAMLARTGVPVEFSNAVMTFAGFVAPALALFVVARRWTSPFWALLLAFVLLVQRPGTVGYASPLAGMWTFGLGAGAVIMFASRLHSTRPSARIDWGLAGWLAVIALTHAFALVAAVFIVLIWTVRSSRSKTVRDVDLLRYGAVWALAALMSVAYWWPLMQASLGGAAGEQALSLPALAARLFVPTNIMYLLHMSTGEAIERGAWLTEALPMVGLICAGLWALRRSGEPELHSLARTGALLAGVMMLSVVLAPWYYAPFLGPLSWRMLFWVRVGLALSTLLLLPTRREARAVGKGAWSLSLGVMLGASLLWGKALRDAHPPELAEAKLETQKLFEWLREHEDPAWGRVAMQDTFSMGRSKDVLTTTHLLADAGRYLEGPVLGSHYGISPYPTRWVNNSGRQWLLGQDVRDTPSLLAALDVLNIGVAVTSSLGAGQVLGGSGAFTKLHSVGRYGVWQRVDFRSNWVRATGPGVKVSKQRFALGEIEFHASVATPGAKLLVSGSWHSGWRAAGAPGLRLVSRPDGLIQLEGLPPGEHDLRLTWSDPAWPRWASLAGWALFLAGLGWRRRS